MGILEQRRMRSTQTAIEVGMEHLRVLLPLLAGRVVILLADRWQATAAFVQACHQLRVGPLIWLKRHRKLYRAALPRQPKQRGAPCKHGPLFQGTRPKTYGLKTPVHNWLMSLFLFVGLLVGIKAVSYMATTLQVDAPLTAADRATGFDDQSVLADTLDAARDADWAWFHASGSSS